MATKSKKTAAAKKTAAEKKAAAEPKLIWNGAAWIDAATSGLICITNENGSESWINPLDA